MMINKRVSSSGYKRMYIGIKLRQKKVEKLCMIAIFQVKYTPSPGTTVTPLRHLRSIATVMCKKEVPKVEKQIF